MEFGQCDGSVGHFLVCYLTSRAVVTAMVYWCRNGIQVVILILGSVCLDCILRIVRIINVVFAACEVPYPKYCMSFTLFSPYVFVAIYTPHCPIVFAIHSELYCTVYLEDTQ